LYILKMTENIFNNGLDNKIIEFVEKIPKKYFKAITAQYNHLNNKYDLRSTQTYKKPHKWSNNSSQTSNIRQR